MRQLIEFLFKYRAFFIFLLLQTVCAWMIIANNNYQRAVYLNATAKFSGSLIEKFDNISDFVELRRVNEDLVKENTRLKGLLLNLNPEASDSLHSYLMPSDSLDSVQYVVRAAEVIDNSVRNTNNFITINKGEKDGIFAGMGVINENGVVGKVRSVSQNNAQVISILNTNNLTSSKLKRTNRLGSVQWEGLDPKIAKLLYIPKDVDVQVGDTVVTSGFNAIFPKNEMVGIVKSVQPDLHQRDLEIELTLNVDFGSLTYVNVIENKIKEEIDSLKTNNPLDFNE